MPTENPEDNKAYCKAYYQRLKADPEKWAAYLAKKAARRKKPVEQSKKPVAKPVTKPVEHDPAPVEQKSEPVAKRKVSQEEFQELWEERAAIREFDGNVSRATAEAAAMDELTNPETSPVEKELKFVPEGELDPEDLKGLFD